jgi:hypothetical protein
LAPRRKTTPRIDLLNFLGRVNRNIFRAPAAGAAAVVDLHFVPFVRINSICGNSARGLRKPEFCLNFCSQKFLTSHIWDGIGHFPLKIYPTDLNEYSSFFCCDGHVRRGLQNRPATMNREADFSPTYG